MTMGYFALKTNIIKSFTYEFVCFRVVAGSSPELLFVCLSVFLLTLISDTDLLNLTSGFKVSWPTGGVRVTDWTFSGMICSSDGRFSSFIGGICPFRDLGELPFTLSGGKGLDSWPVGDCSPLSDSCYKITKYERALHNMHVQQTCSGLKL